MKKYRLSLLKQQNTRGFIGNIRSHFKENSLGIVGETRYPLGTYDFEIGSELDKNIVLLEVRRALPYHGHYVMGLVEL